METYETLSYNCHYNSKWKNGKEVTGENGNYQVTNK